MIPPAVAATPTTVQTPTAVVAATSPSATAAFIPSTTIRVSAPIYPIPTPIPATGPTVTLVAEQPIAPLTS